MDEKKVEALTPQQVVEELDKYIVGQHEGEAVSRDRSA